MINVKSYLAMGAAMVTIVGGTSFAATVNAQAPTQSTGTTPTTTQPAPQSAPHPTRVEGKLSSTSGNSITLTTKSGSITANIGSNTWIVVNQNKKAAQGALSDLKANEETTVAGMTTADAKVIDARLVTQGAGANRFAPAGRKAAPKAGKQTGKQAATQVYTVTATTSTSLTVAGAKGKTLTVALSPSTVVLNNGFSTASSIQVNSKVQILGLSRHADKNAPAGSSNATFEARAIRVVNSGSELRSARVTAVNGNTLTVKSEREPNGFTVTLDATTGYRALTPASTAGTQPTLNTASQADVKVGSNLILEGKLSAGSKSLTADAVVILPAHAAHTQKPAPATTPTTKP